MTSFFRSMYNKAIIRVDSVLVISRIIEVSVRVSSLSLRFRLINSKVKFKSILFQPLSSALPLSFLQLHLLTPYYPRVNWVRKRDYSGSNTCMGDGPYPPSSYDKVVMLA